MTLGVVLLVVAVELRLVQLCLWIRPGRREADKEHK